MPDHHRPADRSATWDRRIAYVVRGHRPAIDRPERLLRASLLQAFYSVRSERQLMEQIDYEGLPKMPLAPDHADTARSNRKMEKSEPEAAPQTTAI